MSRCSRIWVVASLLLLGRPPFEAIAVTDLPDTLWGSTTLDAAGSPYRLTRDTFVPAGSVLTIEPGVVVQVLPKVSLIIYGNLQALGAEGDPIRFEPETPGLRWGAIGFNWASGINRLEWIVLHRANHDTIGTTHYAGAVGLFHTDLRVVHAQFEEMGYGGIHGLYANVEVRESSFVGNINKDVLIMLDSTTLVEDCYFHDIGSADAIQPLRTGSCVVRRCVIDGGYGDGIDTNDATVIEVEDTVIRNMLDAGLDLAAGNLTVMTGTVIEGCAIGVKARGGTRVSGSRNTIYDVQTGLDLTDLAEADFVNAIFWGVSGQIVDADSLSSPSLRYCLTGTGDPYEGVGNISGDPRFVNAAGGDFHLRWGSPCIDSGDPESPTDPDGTRCDMGAFPFSQLGLCVLNELVADNESGPADSSGEYDPWLEITAPSPNVVQLDSVFLSDDITRPDRWRFPDGATLEPGDFIVIWADGDSLQGGLHTPFALSPAGGWLGLFRLAPGELLPALVDSLSYPEMGTDAAWGRWPNGSGPWFEMAYPTPGGPNVPSGIDTPHSDPAPPAGLCALIEAVSPMPVSTGSTICVRVPAAGPVRLELFDLGGRRLAEVVRGWMPAGAHRVAWEPGRASGRPICGGVYFLRLVTASGSDAVKVVVAR